MKHRLEHEHSENASHWGWCSCGDWSGGPCTTAAEIRSGHRTHVADEVAREAVETPIGWPAWDDDEDPDEWAEALTREEVMGCR